MLKRLQSFAAETPDEGRPFVASLRELDHGHAVAKQRQWVVLHDITTSDVQLIHWKPISSRKLAVRIEFSPNEALEVIVSAVNSRRCGALYGTSASFYPSCSASG